MPPEHIEERLALAILGQLQDIVAYCDSDYVIQYVNDAYTRVLGIPRAQAVGRPAVARFPASMQTEVTDLMMRVLEGQKLEVDIEDVRADGARVWIHWRAQPIFDEQGRLTGIINVGTDIDARKRAELQKRDMERKLIETQRMDTLGSLAGGIAHDFNNILSAIFGFTELALSRGTPDEQTRMTHRQVLKAAERARDLVKRILSFSRFHESERRPASPQELIEDAARFIRAAIPSTIEMEVNARGDWPPLLVDPHQVHQVLLNLATNAAHAIGDRHGVFKLSLGRQRFAGPKETAAGILEPGDYLVIEASDNGSGIDDETKSRIFEAFFTTKREGEGTGLGLSVVSAIMRGHNGGVDVASTVGVGTQFRLYLPIVPGVELPNLNADEVYAQRLRARGESVAIIDDEETVGIAVERVLQSFGYQTTVYASAAKFLEVFSIAPSGIDLIVTDQTMPGMTGIEMVIRLREEGHELPVLIMTGFSRHLRPEIVQSVGSTVVIRKPFSRVDMGKAVRELLDASI